jgi:hypothetical protein
MAKRPPAKKPTGKVRGASRPILRKRAAARSSRRSTRSGGKAKRPAARARRQTPHPLMAAMAGTDMRIVAGVQMDVARAGDARVKRVIYPAGFHWARHMKPITGTDLCMHAHVGFLVQGEIHIEYADGCVVEHKAPQIVAIDPGHDGWVVGSTPAVLIEVDFERDTVARLGMRDTHRHE